MILGVLVYGCKYTFFIGRDKKVSFKCDLSCCKISDTLNKLIIEYNLPYDIICRVYNEDKIILNKLFSYNLNDLKEVLSNKEKILELFKKDDVINKFIGILNLSLNTYNTFDIINAFIDKGYKFSELLTFYNASTIVKNALYNIIIDKI